MSQRQNINFKAYINVAALLILVLVGFACFGSHTQRLTALPLHTFEVGICDAGCVAFARDCTSNFLSTHERCPRILEVLRTTDAGLGHQLSELVFSLHLSVTSGSALRFKPFEDVRSEHELRGYSFIQKLLGFDAFKELEAN